MQKQNPFNINFGKEPYSIISRRNELQSIVDSFSSEDPNSNVYILTGTRGSGKTVAMTNIKKHFEELDDWICVEINPEMDMLEQLASKLYDEGKMKKLFMTTEFSFSFKGIGLSIKGKEPIQSVSSLLKREFEHLRKKEKRVLITVDEAVSNSYMKVFAHEYQTLLRDKFNVCLLMTGLYKNISILQKEKSLTFLYRAPKIYLYELNSRAIVNSYMNIFEIREKESIELAKFTKGYAYAYQLLGNILYESGKKAIDEEVIQKFDETIQACAYDIIYYELSEREKEIIKCACYSETNEYVLKETQISKNQLSNYKKELSSKGIIEKRRDAIEFKLPRFKEYVLFIDAYYSE